MRHVFLINPHAGKQDQTARIRALADRLAAAHNLDCRCLLTDRPGGAEVLSRALAEAGEPVRIYACGGDGTLNEVVNGAAGYPNAAVTNVPKGTGNDFLRIFGANYAARFSDLAALSRGPQAAFDLMDCNGKLGIGVICAGVDSRVAADVHRYKRLPLVTGPGAYLLSLGVNVLLTDIARPTVVQAGLDRLEEETSIICICNGRYYGGGFMPVGDAQPDDGVLDMVVVPRVSRFTFFRLVGAYAKGRYRSYPEVIRHFHGPAFSFSSPEELVAVIDGEVMRAKSFTVRISERKVAFFYPGDLDYRGEN